MKATFLIDEDFEGVEEVEVVESVLVFLIAYSQF
jgi:hypothetical protein